MNAAVENGRGTEVAVEAASLWWAGQGKDVCAEQGVTEKMFITSVWMSSDVLKCSLQGLMVSRNVCNLLSIDQSFSMSLRSFLG